MDDEEKIVQGVVDTIDAAKDHRYLAAEMLQHLEMVKSQVNTSHSVAHRDLQATFSHLHDLVDKQLAELLKSVDVIADSAIESLNSIEDKVKKEDKSAINIMNQGKGLLFGNHAQCMDEMRTFKKNEDSFKETKMPEVPSFGDVSSICVNFQPEFNNRLQAVLREGATVLSRPPVRISLVLQRPGALMVQWAEVDDDSSHPFGEYHLQYCHGNTSTMKSPVYVDAYKGELTCHTIRHLMHASKYSLRVCGRVDSSAPWCAWSVPCDAITMLPHYEWQADVDGYTISNENKMATRENQTVPSRPLCSCGATYTCGHSITFKIIDTGLLDMDDGIALLTERASDGLRTHGILFVNTLGQIFMDGEEKLTQLPAMARGSTLTFDTDPIASNKVRVSIEMNEKIATFDWCLGPESAAETTSGNSDNGIKLHFAANFKGAGWKIGVE